MKQIYFFLLMLLCFNVFTAEAQIILPDRMYADTIHSPFVLGVASGDPTESHVVLWTYVEGISPGTSKIITVEVSHQSNFASIAYTANLSVDSSTSYTIKFDAGPLNSGTYYYYRFHDNEGNYSVTGRTKTAPVGSVSALRFAIMSCSSIYSGFFNAFARIGERNDIDAVIHLGDYIYDFVDEDEEIRVPNPYPQPPLSLNDFRTRHAYYLLDPDLRYARQMHPFIMVWDNHDMAGNEANQYRGSLQSFHEWTPVRTPQPFQWDIIYRSFDFGELATLVMTDFETFNGLDSINSSPSAWGDVQRNWIKYKISSSNATWKLLGNQKMMGRWSSVGLPDWLNVPGNGIYFDPSSWDGHVAERLDFFDFLATQSINNVMVLSGDAHITLYTDLTTDPDGLSVYNPQTGEGAVAVEFLPSSITRGNMDEYGIPLSAGPLLVQGSNNVNPNHVYAEFFQHGYGIIDIKPDSIVAEIWYSPILNIASEETFHRAYVVRNGENHWRRDVFIDPLNVLQSQNNQTSIRIFPNPNNGIFQLELPNISTATSIEIFDYALRKCASYQLEPNQNIATFHLADFPSGIYILKAGLDIVRIVIIDVK